MIHFNKIKRGMIFILKFHNSYCLSFCLKHESFNLMDNNFKILKNIEGTNIDVPKMKSVFLCPKECLNKYRNRLRMTYKDFRGPPLQMAFQVQNHITGLVQIFSSIPMYDGGDTYNSSIKAWINEVC